MKFKQIRRITLSAAIVLAIIGLILHTGTGSLSSFGWQFIAAICPLGAVEGFLASRSIFAHALVMLGFVIIAGILLGKFFCSWLCPIPPLRRLFSPRRTKKHVTSEIEVTEDAAKTKTKEYELAPALLENGTQIASTAPTESAIELIGSTGNRCSSGCSSCAEKRAKFDSRHIVLGGTLLSTLIFGFPVFCLVCPVGLVFATIIAFWRLVGFNDLGISLIIFPAILLIEVLVLRKWCLKLCPLGAVASLMSLPGRFFRPTVDMSKCLLGQDIECNLCVKSCEELLDPHSPEGMHECSKCGLCVDNCPTKAITIPFLPLKPKFKPKQKSRML
jgi:ferredoxin-type protein NapH